MPEDQNDRYTPAFVAIVDVLVPQTVLERSRDVNRITKYEELLYEYAFTAYAMARKFRQNKRSAFKAFIALVEGNAELQYPQDWEPVYKHVHGELHLIASEAPYWQNEKIGDLSHIRPWNELKRMWQQKNELRIEEFRENLDLTIKAKFICPNGN